MIEWAITISHHIEINVGHLDSTKHIKQMKQNYELEIENPHFDLILQYKYTHTHTLKCNWNFSRVTVLIFQLIFGYRMSSIVKNVNVISASFLAKQLLCHEVPFKKLLLVLLMDSTWLETIYIRNDGTRTFTEIAVAVCINVRMLRF